MIIRINAADAKLLKVTGLAFRYITAAFFAQYPAVVAALFIFIFIPYLNQCDRH
jgi:Flp pilus assembly protein protease CpaA